MENAPVSKKSAELMSRHIRYRRAELFIQRVGGELYAKQIIDAGEAFLCVSWSVYPLQVRFDFARIAGVETLKTHQHWCDMDMNTQWQIADGMGKACQLALDILANPPEYWRAA